jgi:hypothetical protein
MVLERWGRRLRHRTIFGMKKIDAIFSGLARLPPIFHIGVDVLVFPVLVVSAEPSTPVYAASPIIEVIPKIEVDMLSRPRHSSRR